MRNTLATCNITAASLGDPTYVEVFSSSGLITPAAREWMLRTLSGDTGIGEVLDITLYKTKFVFELTAGLSYDDACTVVWKSILRLGTAIEKMDDDEFNAMFYASDSDVDPMAVSSNSSAG